MTYTAVMSRFKIYDLHRKNIVKIQLGVESKDRIKFYILHKFKKENNYMKS